MTRYTNKTYNSAEFASIENFLQIIDLQVIIHLIRFREKLDLLGPKDLLAPRGLL